MVRKYSKRGASDDESSDDGVGLLRSMIGDLAATTSGFTATMRREAMRWAVILKFMLSQAVDRITSGHDEDGAPLCRTYQSDGWSVWAGPRQVANSSAMKMSRTGKVRLEFLLEFGVVKSWNKVGAIATTFDMRPPRPMMSGLKCWNIFNACCEFWSLPRQAGNRGLVVSNYIQDGLHASLFSSLSKARHRLWYQQCDIDDEDYLWLLQQTEIASVKVRVVRVVD